MVKNEDMPTDLVADILARLPAKPLMRFKCVQKSWYSLIQNPRFVAKHLLCFNKKDNIKGVDHLLVKRTRPATFDSSDQCRKAFISLLSFNQVTNHTSLNLLDLPYYQNNVTHIQILGPCNGIYCLYSIPISLINPSTRELKVVPNYPIRSSPGTYNLQSYPGFGFDPKTNDYKVVLLMDSWREDTNENLGWLAEIYSLKSNCWRQVDCPVPASISIWCESWIHCYVHRAYHWWGYDDVGDLILAFDISDEMFRTIRGPNLGISSEEIAGIVASFKESISVITYPREGTEKYFDVWVMEDYGKEESWTKQLRIGPILDVERPLGFWRNRQLLLEDSNGRMVLYDPDAEEIKNLVVHGERSSLQAAIYMESLVSLRGETEENQAGISYVDIVPDPIVDGSSV
ncbi:F-box protein family [Quillaja saponaria]|uniref:F-box protein family n=1 Tax=Quillaja saponaria TaxID=32244 RepID=A0AAD7VGE9_QUISA|nr:F-box protein family [Quillaja saponaria]